jgi:hypothetical protein
LSAGVSSAARAQGSAAKAIAASKHERALVRRRESGMRCRKRQGRVANRPMKASFYWGIGSSKSRNELRLRPPPTRLRANPSQAAIDDFR